MKRKIAAVTTSRADFTALYWPLRDLASHPDVDLKIIALGPHLSPEFGWTAREIETAGFSVHARILPFMEQGVAFNSIRIDTSCLHTDYLFELTPVVCSIWT